MTKILVGKLSMVLDFGHLKYLELFSKVLALISDKLSEKESLEDYMMRITLILLFLINSAFALDYGLPEESYEIPKHGISIIITQKGIIHKKFPSFRVKR